ncbi:hypothetical protein [Ensifer aridi]|uniref:hypothetical protein n=1 Tax=Ensifer aridi TaxID=1708715 RepID=UPI000A10B074|nr:hypothetical protein [Ensifer aridi]
MTDDEYEAFSVKILEGLEPAGPRPSQPITQPVDISAYYFEFEQEVAGAARRLFYVDQLPRSWTDSVILHFNTLEAGDVIDRERREGVVEALARSL